MRLYYNIVIILIIASLFSEICADSNNIDLQQFIYRLLRRIVWSISEDSSSVYKRNQLEGKAQKSLNKSQEFFCNTKNGRSKTIPSSINQLRPGDIDIIGAIGDSLSAANGGISSNLLHTGREHRGISFSGGGHRTWRKFITLPNILKEFNPNLYGYATDDSLTMDRQSKFNVAEPMSMSSDTYFAAHILAKRMELDPLVNMTHHWKLLTIYIGNLDFCADLCRYETLEDWVKQHEKELVKTLRFLRDTVPRLLINLVSIPNLLELRNINHTSTHCKYVVPAGCPCVFKPNANEEYYNYLRRGLKMWLQREFDICNLDEFNTEDFVVINQPLISELTLPFDKNGNLEIRYFASDCFHFSQVGHAYVAVGLWNNMLQPIGNKSTNINANPNEFLCPSEKFPYILTRKNSPKLWTPNKSEIAKKIIPIIL